jgi:hypothetical protein
MITDYLAFLGRITDYCWLKKKIMNYMDRILGLLICKDHLFLLLKIKIIDAICSL